MRRTFFILLLGLSLGAFAYSGIVPQHAFASPQLIVHKPIIVATLEKKLHRQNDTATSIRTMDKQAGKISLLSKALVGKRFQGSLGVSWPLISIPDFSFLWKQQQSRQKKDEYDYGQ